MRATVQTTQPLKGERRQQLRIGTLNVHGWTSGTGAQTFDEIAALLVDADLDVICLQEATRHRIPALAERLGDYAWASSHNTAVLSRTPLRARPGVVCGFGSRARGKQFSAKAQRQECSVRHTPVDIELPEAFLCGGGDDGEPCLLKVVSLHLDHVSEPRRLSEASMLAAHLAEVGGGPEALGWQLWCGDYNALTQSDYSTRQWGEVQAVRARNSWEPPRSTLTDELTAETKSKKHQHKAGSLGCWGFVDARKVASLPVEGPLSTCRFGTRIDYVMIGRQLARRMEVRRHEHRHAIPHASDHNLVVATLVALPQAA